MRILLTLTVIALALAILIPAAEAVFLGAASPAASIALIGMTLAISLFIAISLIVNIWKS